MLTYLAKRLAVSVVTVFGVVVVVFFVVQVLPGDAAAERAGPNATAELVEQIRHQYGLDRPLWARFISYLGNVVTGDFGTSIQTNQPVVDELLKRLPATLELTVYSVLLAAIVGFALGILGGSRAGSRVDGATRVFAVVGSSTAVFWLGLVLIYFLSFRLNWFPSPVDRLPFGATPPRQLTGFYTVDALLAGDGALFWVALRQLMLPVITLAFVLSAPIIKMVRASLIQALDQDYVRTSRAVGIPWRSILIRDGMRNALLPVVTILGIVFGYMIGGNIIVEFLFSWPGVGRYAYSAVQGHDLDALQGFVIMVGILYVALNVVVDVLYALVDPRIRLSGGGSR
jgi:ABC-type dipeptide/oligopeptide/nickel transport system permease component